MKKNIHLKVLKGLCIAFMFVFFSNKVQAQCRFVQIKAAGDTSVISLPCDFPVLNFTTASESEKGSFNLSITDWKSKYAGFNHISFIPAAGNEYFEISQQTFVGYSDERRSIISSMPSFYQVK